MGCQSSSPIKVPKQRPVGEKAGCIFKVKSPKKASLHLKKISQECLQVDELSIIDPSTEADSLQSSNSAYNESYCDSISLCSRDQNSVQDAEMESIFEIRIKEFRYLQKELKVSDFFKNSVDLRKHKASSKKSKRRQRLKMVDMSLEVRKEQLPYHCGESLYTKFAKMQKNSVS